MLKNITEKQENTVLCISGVHTLWLNLVLTYHFILLYISNGFCWQIVEFSARVELSSHIHALLHGKASIPVCTCFSR